MFRVAARKAVLCLCRLNSRTQQVFGRIPSHRPGQRRVCHEDHKHHGRGGIRKVAVADSQHKTAIILLFVLDGLCSYPAFFLRKMWEGNRTVSKRRRRYVMQQ